MNKFLDMHNIKDPLCIDCRITKMKRISHNKTTPKANQIIEVIHSDIIGPINASITGKRYIIIFIDEKSHKSWIFLLDKKSKAIETTINFLKYLNNLFDDKSVKVFKSDNAKEYKNRIIIKYCEENGIMKTYSPPYSPENNGLAERFNQTLISCTKTLLYWSKLSENFWDYAILYANYLYNKTPHQISKNNIPDESFYGYKVKLNHIRTFGCITYYKNYNQNKSKLSENSLKGIFLGFSEPSNCYIIMDYNDYKIHNVNEILCLEDEPANISLSNQATNFNEDVSFFNFDFNFSKMEKINKNYFFLNSNNSNYNSNKSRSTLKDQDFNNSNNNNIITIPDPISSNNDEYNDINNPEVNTIPLAENDDEDYYSAEENASENIFDQNEKIFNNKKLSNFEENQNLPENYNNLGSNSSFNKDNNNNNLSSEKIFDDINNNNLSSKNLNFSNSDNKNKNN